MMHSIFKDLKLSSQSTIENWNLAGSTYQPPLQLDFIFKLSYFHYCLIFVRQVFYIYDRHSLPTEEASRVICHTLTCKHLKAWDNKHTHEQIKGAVLFTRSPAGESLLLSLNLGYKVICINNPNLLIWLNPGPGLSSLSPSHVHYSARTGVCLGSFQPHSMWKKTQTLHMAC